MNNDKLLPAANWQTQQRGYLQDEYAIYVVCAKDLGWKIKTYEEWLRA
jgi:hypothetical protein